MIELFFVILLLKGQFNKQIYTFTTCRVGPLYGLGDPHKILQIKDIGLTSRAPLFEKS
jgi:hypothetical protein